MAYGSEFAGGVGRPPERVRYIRGPQGLQGPPGPQGEPGPPGSIDTIAYLHIQGAAASSWVMNHNLGFKPNISIRDESGNPINARIIHHSDNQAEAQFNIPRAGEASAT